MSEQQDAEQTHVIINAYATVRELPALTFPHRPLSRRDLEDPALTEHLGGMAGYVLSRGDRQMTATRYQLWRHVQRVRHQVSFAFDSEADDAAHEALEAWARQANAIFFVPSGAILDPELNAILNADGTSDEGAEPPFLPDAHERRERSLTQLGALSERLPAMPPSLSDAEAMLRTAKEVRARALGLLQVLRITDGLLNAPEASAPELNLEWLTEEERAFVEADPPDLEAAKRLSWRWEALNVLAWALTRDGEPLPPADRPIAPESLLQTMRRLEASSARLRPLSEILDALDLTWRQHWLTRDARLSERPLPALLEDVVMERHHALNWITGFQNPVGIGWDDVETPT